MAKMSQAAKGDSVMGFKVGVGKSDFEDIRRSDNYYVDKTDLLYELVEETDNKVTLFTRPRRFGKTLMVSMMSNFFSIKKDSRDIFEGLKIAEQKEFCGKWMNQYPVLFISFKDVEALTFENACRMPAIRVADVCKEHSSLMEEGAVNAADAEIFRKLMYTTADVGEIKSCLKTIMRIIHIILLCWM